MKKRERILLLVTILVIGLGLGFTFLAPVEEEGDEAGVIAGDLATEREALRESLKILNPRQGKRIQEEYRQLAASLDDQKVAGMDAGMVAQNQVYRLLTEQLEVATPDVTNPRPEEIKNVDDYYFINLEVRRLTGTYEEMVKLLRNMESKGLLIKRFKLTQPRYQEDQLDMEVTVSRLVKHDELSRKRMKTSSWGFRR